VSERNVIRTFVPAVASHAMQSRSVYGSTLSTTARL